MATTRRVHVGNAAVTLIGTVQGFVPDGLEVQRVLEAEAPHAIGLGVPPEDLEAIRVLATSNAPETLIAKSRPRLTGAAAPVTGAPGTEAILGGGERGIPTAPDDEEPFASLDPAQERFLELLSRFGPVRLPSPDLDQAYRWAAAHDVRLEALDLDDESHAEVYIRANRFRDVWRSGRIQGKLVKKAFDDAQDSDALAIAWDAFQNSLPSLQKVEAAREKEMARRVEQIASGGTRMVAVVPVARLKGLVSHLGDATD